MKAKLFETFEIRISKKIINFESFELRPIILEQNLRIICVIVCVLLIIY